MTEQPRPQNGTGTQKQSLARFLMVRARAGKMHDAGCLSRRRARSQQRPPSVTVPIKCKVNLRTGHVNLSKNENNEGQAEKTTAPTRNIVRSNNVPAEAASNGGRHSNSANT